MTTEPLSADFNGRPLTIIYRNDEPHFTAEHIGHALEYENPRKAVMKIHERNRDELEEYSGVVNLTTPGGTQPTRIFNEEGVMIITMLSRQPKAREFRRWAVKVLKAYRRGDPLEPPQPPRMGRVDAALLREYRLTNPRLAQAYLVSMGVTPLHVAEVLGHASALPTVAETHAAPFEFVRERASGHAGAGDDRYWYFTREQFAALCGEYDQRDTAHWLRDLGLLRSDRGRLTSKAPPRLFDGRRPNVFVLIKRLLDAQSGMRQTQS